MMLDTKTQITIQQIENDRKALLAQLLAERYGDTTRPDIQVKTE